MTIGDVLAVIAAFVLVGASWGATLLLVALAFPARTRAARARLETAPGRCLRRGLGVLLAVGLPALVLGQGPGPVRLLAGALWAGLVAVAALGGAGIIGLLGERIESVGTPMTPFAARTRATFLFVTAGFLPVVGWFVVAPAALLIALGAGFSALRPAASPARGAQAALATEPVA